MEPITRKEKYLAKLNGQDISIDPPITNEEYYLAYLCGEDYGLPTPVTLDEMYLAAMCGVIYVLPMPITRLQRIWKQLIETGESDITPGTREELYWVGVDLWDIVYSTVSGNPVMFTAIHPDLLKQLKVAFSPVQDLHGYDSPWPAGGGVNKFDPSAATDGKRLDNVGGLVNSANWCVSDWIPVTPNTDYYAKYIIPSANGYAFCFYDADKTFLRNAVVSGGGEGVRNSGADAAYMRCTIRLEDKSTAGMIAQSSSFLPYSPYSNLCPISGWDGVEVYIRGTNLFDGTYEPWGVSADKIANTNGRTAIVPIKGGEKYTINKIGTSNRSVYYEAYETPTVGTSVVKIGETAIPMTVTTSANAKYLVIYVSTSSEQAEPQMTVVLGETASDYVAYDSNSQTISISFGSTVYSGTLDVLTGVVKARPYFASYNGETLVGPWMSSMDKYVAGTTPTVGAQVVDMGGTETTIQLTPQEVSSLLGENNVWSDANGDLTVEYRSA